MGVVGRLKQGDLMIAGEINERLPAVTNGLVAHFPFDGRGGAFDMIGGYQDIQNVVSGVNLIEAMNINWRDPSSWTVNSGMSWDDGMQALKIVDYHNSWLKTPIVVDTNKHYQVSMDVMEEVQSSTGLYLGGYCINKDYIRVTPNYDYSYATNAQPATGVWTTYRVTRYGTGTITNNTSTTFNTVVGWTGTATGVTDLLTKYYYYGGLFNYNSGGVMYIRNLSIVVVDTDTSNTTPADDGLYVDESTTNVVTYTNLDNGWAKGYGTNIKWNDIAPPNGVNSQVVSFNLGAYINYGYWYSYGDYAPQEPNTTYTVSLWVKTDQASNVGMYFYTADSSEVNRYISEYQYFNASDGWKRLVWNPLTTGATWDSDSLSFFFSGIEGWNTRIWLCAPQMEAKAYPTSFVAGSRASSNFEIPFDSVPPYTINFWHKSHKPLSTIVDQPTSPHILHLGRDYASNASISFWNYIGNLRCYIKGNVASSWTAPSSTGYTFTSQTWDNVEHMYTIVAVDSRTFKVYMDGIFLSTHVSSEDVTNIDEKVLRFFGGYYPDARYRDLSIYNRVLSDAEISKLATPSFSITSTGGLVTSNYNERPVKSETAKFYFPLSSDTTSYITNTKPSYEANTVYENGALWVGNSTTNLLTANQSSVETDLTGFNVSTSTWLKNTGASMARVTTKQWADSASLQIITTSASTRQGMETTGINASANTTYTISAWVTGTPGVSMQLYARDYTNSISPSPVAFTLTDAWQRIRVIITTGANSVTGGSVSTGLVLSIQTTSAIAATFYVDGLQIEQKSFVSPWVLGGTTRGASEIRHPLAKEGIVWATSSGVSIDGDGNLTKTATTAAWDAGSASKNTITNGEYLEMVASEANTYRMFGLSNTSPDNNYTTIQYTWYLVADGTLQVRESGSNPYATTYTTGDRLKIAVENNVVKYYKNDGLVYTSAVAPTLPLLVDTSLYSPTATLKNIWVYRNKFSVKQDFTIYGWFNMADINTTSYEAILTRSFEAGGSDRLLIMLNDGNPNMYVWWGNASTGSAMLTAPMITVEVGKWNFFALRRSDNTMTLFHGQNGGALSTASANATALDTGLQHINAWKFGQWYTGNTAHRMNGYIKDFTFFQSALSDASINEIYYTHMRQSKGKLHVQGKIVEAQTLL